jgi:hypothetical protein
MVNKKIWLGILAMVLAFGTVVVKAEAQSNRGGEFILTNIPSRYDGRITFSNGNVTKSYTQQQADKKKSF